MLYYLTRRLFWIILTLLCVSAITFTLVLSAPGDPAQALVGGRSTQANVDAIRKKYALDQPLYMQYGLYMSGLLRGDLGYSYTFSRPVSSELLTKLRPTALLAIAILAVALLMGIPLGVLTAQYSRTKLDYSVNIIGLMTVSLPAFVFGLLLIYVFAYRLRWVPIGGFGSLRHLILPTLTVAIPWSVWYASLLRVNLLNIANSDYVRMAHAKGLHPRTISLRHMLPNALAPVLTMVSMDLAGLLTGLVIVESVFNWPGVGWMAVQAARTRDIPVIMATVLFGALLIGLGNLIADLVTARLDPRIRLGE